MNLAVFEFSPPIGQIARRFGKLKPVYLYCCNEFLVAKKLDVVRGMFVRCICRALSREVSSASFAME